MASSAPIVKYGGYSLEKAQEEKETIDKNSGGGKFLKLVVGRNVVRFLPPPVGKATPFVLTHQHIINVDGIANPVSFNCPRVMANAACPACAMVEKLRASKSPADYDRAGKMFPKLRVYANVISRSNPELGPQVLAMGKTIHEELISIRSDTKEGGDFTDPNDDGFDIIIERTGTGMNTQYSVRPARSGSALGDMTWIEQQVDLIRYAKVPSIEEIQQQMSAGVGAGGGGGGEGRGRGRGRQTAAATTTVEEEDAPPPGRGAGGKKQGRSVEDDVNEVDDE